MIKIKNLVYSKQGKLLSIWRILRLIIISFFIALLISRLFGILSIPFNIYVRQPIAIICIIIVTILLDKETIDNQGIELKLKSVLLFIIGIAWAYFCCIQIEIVGFFTTDSGIQFANPFTKNALLSLGFLLISIALPEELYTGVI